MVFWQRLTRGRGHAAPQPQAPAPSYDRESERITSAEILAQAKWLYEQHERRVQNCQNMAVALLSIVGAIMAVAPSRVPDDPSAWHYGTLGLVAASGIGTIVQCMRILVPRSRINGLPSVQGLRDFALSHERQGPTKIPIPETQFAVDMLNPLNLTESSPLTHAAKNAEDRTALLFHAYWWFAATFSLVVTLSFLSALLG